MPDIPTELPATPYSALCRETTDHPHPDPIYDAELVRWHETLSKRCRELEIEADVMRDLRPGLKSEYAAACFVLRAIHGLRFKTADHQVVLLTQRGNHVYVQSSPTHRGSENAEESSANKSAPEIAAGQAAAGSVQRPCSSFGGTCKNSSFWEHILMPILDEVKFVCKVILIYLVLDYILPPN